MKSNMENEDKEEVVIQMNFWAWAHEHPIALVIIIYIVCLTVESVLKMFLH